MSKQDAS